MVEIMAEFEEPLCGCLSDMTTCLVAFCLPCGVCCLQAKAVDMSTNEGFAGPCLLLVLTYHFGVGCIGGAINRMKIKSQFSIKGEFLNECLIWWFCCPCAATQEYREVRKRSPN